MTTLTPEQIKEGNAFWDTAVLLRKHGIRSAEPVKSFIPQSPTPRQKLFLDLVNEKEVFYGGAAGGGKFLRLDEPIPTPSGWTWMGVLREGDVVFDEKGCPCTVTDVFAVETPEQCYRITFDDGSTIDAGAEHQWLTYTATELAALTRRTPEFRESRREKRASRATGRRSELFTQSIVLRNQMNPPIALAPPTGGIRTTQEIFHTLFTRTGRTNHAIPLAEALLLDEWDLPLDPYCLGAWLGDGTASGGGFTGVDPEIWQQFELNGFEVTHGKNGKSHYIKKIVGHLRYLNVFKNKHIPAIYLRGSRSQRLALLQGLMDTDGTVYKSGSVEFTNTNKRLIDGIYELIISLGWKCRVMESRATLYGKDCGPKWDIKWTPSEYVFRLERKRSRQKLATRRTTQFRYIVSCEAVESVPMRCIRVDSPSHCYLAGRQMVPTHNSSCLLMDALKYVDVPGYSALLLRRTYADLSKQGALMDRAKEWLSSTSAKWNEQRKLWTFPSGARLAFGYLETENDKFQYQGAEYQYIGFDELSQFTETQYTYLFSRLRRLKDSEVPIRMRGASNPGGYGSLWVKNRFIPEDFTPDDATEEKVWTTETTDDETGETITRHFVPARLDDNPHLDQAEYELSLRELDPVTRAQLRRGDWQITVKGDILYMWSEPHVIITWSEFEKVFGSRHIPFHWKLGVFQDWGCLTLDTDILTQEGWKKHSELKIGELVAAYDWKDKRSIVWTPLRHIVYKQDQELVTMKNKSFKFTATPDHCWLVKRKKRGRMVRDTYARQRLDTIPKDSHLSFIIAADCHEAGTLDLTDGEASVLGWLVTDGWVSTKIAYLCQKNYADLVIHDLNRSGLGWKELQPKPNGVRIFRLTKEGFATLRERSGYVDKHSLSGIVTKLSPSAREAMLDAMLMAEGTNNGTNRMALFCQTKGPISDAFQILATLCGVRLGIQREHQSQWGKSHRIPLLRTRQMGYPQIHQEEGLHDVWCPTVDEGAVIARQNGQVTITGNTTTGHPCITKWFATASENSPVVNGIKLAGSVFVYRSMMTEQTTAREMKQKIYHAMTEHNEIPRTQYWEMSHEASSERMEYKRMDDTTPYALPFRNWDTGKTRGIEQFKHALTLRDTEMPHPFKSSVFGRPLIYFIVDDEQAMNPKDERGMLRIRAEAPAYRWETPKSGEIALKLTPYALFNDAIDVVRSAAAKYFPTETLKTMEERVDELIPQEAKDTMVAAQTGAEKTAAMLNYEFQQGIAEATLGIVREEYNESDDWY